MKINTIATVAIVCFAIAVPITSLAQLPEETPAASESVSGSGGVLTAPTTGAPNYGTIILTGIKLSNGGTASLSCPVTFFGEGTYSWNWYCSGGALTIDRVLVATFDPNPYLPTMTLSCSGGGRGNPRSCYYTFSAATVAPNKSAGMVQFSFGPRGDALFTASW